MDLGIGIFLLFFAIGQPVRTHFGFGSIGSFESIESVELVECAGKTGSSDIHYYKWTSIAEYITSLFGVGFHGQLYQSNSCTVGNR